MKYASGAAEGVTKACECAFSVLKESSMVRIIAPRDAVL